MNIITFIIATAFFVTSYLINGLAELHILRQPYDLEYEDTIRLYEQVAGTAKYIGIGLVVISFL